MSSYLGLEDNYLPSVAKPLLQKVDNYQIYDVYCTRTKFINSITGVWYQNRESWLAVQAYNPTQIGCDFNAIAQEYK